MYSVSLQVTCVQLKRITWISICIGISSIWTVSGGQGTEGETGCSDMIQWLPQSCYIFAYSSYTCCTLNWVTEGTVACPIWGLDGKIVDCSTIKTLDSAGGICAVTVQLVSIVCLSTAIVIYSIISACPWEQRRLIGTVERNWETLWLTGTWTDRKWKTLHNSSSECWIQYK